MKRLLLLFFPIVILCSACKKDPGQDQLFGSWRLFDVGFVNPENSSFDDQAMLRSDLSSSIILSLFRDGNYTEIDGDSKYIHGGITFEQEYIHFQDGANRSTFSYTITKQKEGTLVLTLSDVKTNIARSFTKNSNNIETETDDPFHPTNNNWRIKAAKSEDSLTLVKRLKDHIKHTALILKAADELKSEVVSFEYSQGPIKIYNGGIGIKDFEVVDTCWKKTFYNVTECEKAYTIYDHILSKGKYKGSKAGGWVKVDYNILLNIYSRF